MISRAVLDVFMEGLPDIPISCLVDSGALFNRFSDRYAEWAGIDLNDAEVSSPFAVGGKSYEGRTCRVSLSVGEFSWEAEVCFVSEWSNDFQLLGQEGFFRFFDVCFSAAEEYFDFRPARR